MFINCWLFQFHESITSILTLKMSITFTKRRQMQQNLEGLGLSTYISSHGIREDMRKISFHFSSLNYDVPNSDAF